MKRFELTDENTKILKAHTCEKCDYILYEAYECKEKCTVFCKDHLPENKKCEICDGEFLFDQIKTESIKNRYEVKCSNCPSKMMLKDFDSHLKEGCKKECTQKCGQLFSTEEEMKKHIKEKCFQTVTKCLGCSYSSKRGEVNIHQEICEEMEKIKQIRFPLEKKIEQLEEKNQEQDNQILLLIEHNQKQEEEIKDLREEISFLKKYVEEQKKKEKLEKKMEEEEEEERKRKEEALKKYVIIGNLFKKKN